MARNITVQHEGFTFTRRTERSYTHLVVCRRNFEHERLRDADLVRERVLHNWSFYVKVANGTEEHPEVTTQELRERSQRYVAAGRNGAIKLAQEEWAMRQAAEQQASGNGFLAYSWHTRRDLAERAANEARAFGKLDVTIIEITEELA